MMMRQVVAEISAEAACELVLEYVLVAVPNTKHQHFLLFVTTQIESKVFCHL